MPDSEAFEDYQNAVDVALLCAHALAHGKVNEWVPAPEHLQEHVSEVRWTFDGERVGFEYRVPYDVRVIDINVTLATALEE